MHDKTLIASLVKFEKSGIAKKLTPLMLLQNFYPHLGNAKIRKKVYFFVCICYNFVRSKLLDIVLGCLVSQS